MLQIRQRPVLGWDQAAAAIDLVEEDRGVFWCAIVLDEDNGVLNSWFFRRGEHNSILPYARVEERDGFGVEFKPLGAQQLHLHRLCVGELLRVAPALEGLEEQLVLRWGWGGRERETR